MIDYSNFFKNSLKTLKDEGNYRIFADLEKIAGNFPQALNYNADSVSEVTVWCSNDYLGMGQHPFVLEAIERAMHEVGAGSGGTRNISGTNSYHILLEQEISNIHKKDSALLFTSGYVANQSSISVLGSKLKNCIIFSDEKNHASIIKGIKSSKAEKKIFKHNNITHLESLLKEVDISRPKIIIFESVYSMDGDFTPIKKIVDLAKKLISIANKHQKITVDGLKLSLYQAFAQFKLYTGRNPPVQVMEKAAKILYKVK